VYESFVGNLGLTRYTVKSNLLHSFFNHLEFVMWRKL